MPYRANTDLPPPVRAHLPAHAQDIYRAAFNHAFASHAADERQEEIAHRTAWAAVKRSYVKLGDHWAPLAPQSLTFSCQRACTGLLEGKRLRVAITSSSSIW